MSPLNLPPTLTARGIGLRRQRDEDRAFLRALYGEQRAFEMASVAWPAAARTRFVDDQFRLQSAHFAANSAAELRIVTRAAPPLAGGAIGRLYLDRSGPKWHLLEIGLIAAERRQGIGTAIIEFLKSAATDAGAAGVSLNVANDNTRAAGLYRRLGFGDVETTSATHRRLEWQPGR